MDDRASGIVETIYQQLGGKGFAMMIGMNFPILVSEDKKTGNVTATFRWRAHANDSLNLMEVTLDEGKDLYRVTFGSLRGGEAKRQPTLKDIYCEDLRRIFEQTTGLATILPRVINIDKTLPSSISPARPSRD